MNSLAQQTINISNDIIYFLMNNINPQYSFLDPLVSDTVKIIVGEKNRETPEPVTSVQFSSFNLEAVVYCCRRLGEELEETEFSSGKSEMIRAQTDKGIINVGTVSLENGLGDNARPGRTYGVLLEYYLERRKV
ncbi:hypothetical protein GOV04_05575 [Candidatus Woesearchaeota archaeon]|nr:hypothetical protein [Candidatus Woesearchaeota archaeon]